MIGKDVPYALLAAIAEQPDDVLRGALAHLQEAEFLYETQLFPDVEHTFKHALTHEVTYGSLLQGDFAAATRVLEPGLASCRAMEIRVALPFVALSLGSAYLWSGRAAAAVPLLEEAVAAPALPPLRTKSSATKRAGQCRAITAPGT